MKHSKEKLDNMSRNIGKAIRTYHKSIEENLSPNREISIRHIMKNSSGVTESQDT